MENDLREFTENFGYFDKLVQAGFGKHYIEGELAFVLNAKVPLEGNDIRRRSLSGSSESMNCFTILIFHHNALNSGKWP